MNESMSLVLCPLLPTSIQFVSFGVFLDSFPEMGSNPLKAASIEMGAFADLKRVSYIRIADTNITEIPKGKVIK